MHVCMYNLEMWIMKHHVHIHIYMYIFVHINTHAHAHAHMQHANVRVGSICVRLVYTSIYCGLCAYTYSRAPVAFIHEVPYHGNVMNFETIPQMPTVQLACT